MQLQTASRKRAKIKMALQGPSGSGKTYSSLLLANGLCNDWSKIAVIDTENHSAELYAHLGKYNTISLAAPFAPERYLDAIAICEKAGIQVIILDSISHEWEGSGGILDVHGNMAGNSFTNWAKLTPRHNAFIQAMLQSPCHIIGTIRSKQDYVLSERNGKVVPEKVGLKGVTRDGMDYEFTLVFDLDIKHNAAASKDRTGLFGAKPEFRISAETGKQILAWCNSGEPQEASQPANDIEQRINDCASLKDLLSLYQQLSTGEKQQLSGEFTTRKAQLTTGNPPISSLPKSPANGKYNSPQSGK